MANYKIHDAMTVSPTRCAICSNQNGPGILMLVAHPDVGPIEMYVGHDCCFVQMARSMKYLDIKQTRTLRQKNADLKKERDSLERKLQTATNKAVNEFLDTVREGQPRRVPGRVAAATEKE